MDRVNHSCNSHTTSSTKKYCCSYCREEGHNITKCGSPRIAELDKKGEEIGLFDIILLLFCNSNLVNRTIVFNEKYNFTKRWLNNLTNQEIKVLTHKFHETNKNESIENQKKRLFYYYFDDKITNYSLEEYTEMLFDIKVFPKDKFNIYGNMYVDLIEEPELKRELKNELTRISHHLYPSNKFNLKITKIYKIKMKQQKPKIQKDCPICYEIMKTKTLITTNCNHDFCDTCIKSYLDSCRKHPSCPLCRESVMELKTPTKKTQQMLKKYCIEKVKPQMTQMPQMPLQEQPEQSEQPEQPEQPEENTNIHDASGNTTTLMNILHSIVGF